MNNYKNSRPSISPKSLVLYDVYQIRVWYRMQTDNMACYLNQDMIYLEYDFFIYDKGYLQSTSDTMNARVSLHFQIKLQMKLKTSMLHLMEGE